MAIESGGGSPEEPQEISSKAGESLGESEHAGIHGLRENQELRFTGQQAGSEGLANKVPYYDPVAHFPVSSEAAAPAVAREVTLMQDEGVDTYIHVSKRTISATDPTFVTIVSAEGDLLGQTESDNMGQQYIIGAMVGHNAISAQHIDTTPIVNSGVAIAATRDLAEERLLASFTSGAYTPRPDPEEGYFEVITPGAPPEDQVADRAAYFQGAERTYRLLKGADEVRKLERQFRLKYRP